VSDSVDSHDGTRIACHRDGTGPPVVLVGGALTDHTENAPLAARSAADFTVYNYDRRGRGDSGDTEPDAVRREIEDLAAIIEHAGGARTPTGCLPAVRCCWRPPRPASRWTGSPSTRFLRGCFRSCCSVARRPDGRLAALSGALHTLCFPQKRRYAGHPPPLRSTRLDRRSRRTRIKNSLLQRRPIRSGGVAGLRP